LLRDLGSSYKTTHVEPEDDELEQGLKLRYLKKQGGKYI